MSLPNQAAAQPQGVEAYFTDVEHLRNAFKDAILAPTLARRLLIVHGVGGAGKSSLLQMFRLECKRNKIPVALASGDESKSVVDIFYRKAEAGDERGWAPDLKADSVTLPTFAKTLEHYRAIQAKVEAQVRKEASVRAAEIAGKAASKTAEAAAGAAFGAALGSLAPGIGTAAGAALGGVVGGMGAEAFVDWLRSSLNLGKPDIDLLLDPAKALSEDFLADIAKAAATKRIVLMLDTYEQLTALGDWAREFAQRLHPNVLLVTAGRAVPDWQRQWPGWLAQAQVEEVKPMTDAIMRELAVRYYRTLRGSEPDPVQVDAIVRFARGLPVVVTSAINIWVEYGVEDFQSVKSQVVADLVDRLMEGVPAEMAPLLEAAATVRWFNKEILRAVTQTTDVNAAYNELRRFPFARPRAEGFMLHDTVREMIDANLKVEDPERYRELHERAAAYFEARLAKVTGEEAERLALERLYHRVCADEETGIRLFQEMAEELVRFQMVNRLRSMLTDVANYELESEDNCLWRGYYFARLAHLECQFEDAKVAYEKTIADTKNDRKLRAYALCDLAEILSRREWLYTARNESQIHQLAQMSLDSGSEIDFKLSQNYRSQFNIFLTKREWDRAEARLKDMVQSAQTSGDTYQLAMVYQDAKSLHSRTQEWARLLHDQENLGTALQNLPKHLPLRAVLLSGSAVSWVWAGLYREAEAYCQEALSALNQLEWKDFAGVYRDLGLAMAMQGRFQQLDYFLELAMSNARTIQSPLGEGIGLCFWGLGKLRQGEIKSAIGLLTDSQNVRKQIHALPDEGINFLGIAHEVQGNYSQARSCYHLRLESNWGRNWLDCGALTGLVRVDFAEQLFDDITSSSSRAEQLAQQYEYNDHLASLRLTQGHIAWDGRLDAWGVGFDAALHHYQQALVYALRFNRFLLDETLAGRPQGTPLQPVIPTCLARGEEGRHMLRSLRDWWQTGVNDVGVPRPDTISPLPEGIPLLEAERIARAREPGDGSPQTPVLAQIAAVVD